MSAILLSGVTIIKWQILRHNGVAFPPDYEPRGLKIKINGRVVQLEPLQEEMLMAWAKKIGTPYVEDPVFQENFLLSLREQWADLFADVKISDIDFSEMFKIAQSEKLANLPEEKRKELSAQRKIQREELKAKFGHARVDDNEVEIGAYLIEPPGIFMGRGEHPLRGRWKPRVFSYQVTLNLDEDAEIPYAPHGEWAGVVSEHDSLWVARWLETLTDKVKYVWLAETSPLRQEREQAKYDKATTLKGKIDAVLTAIGRSMNSKDAQERQLATVAYLIYRLAMRVGDEKDEDEADTVGASTLRVEHVTVSDGKIDFDFLGKDSVRWERTLLVQDNNDRALAKNLTAFMERKSRDAQFFPDVTSQHVNKFLKSLKNSRGKVIMKDLSAKVFRTYLATNEVTGYLKKGEQEIKDKYDAEHYAKMANLQAAIKCNHKRTPPKTWDNTRKKLEDRVAMLSGKVPEFPNHGEKKEELRKAKTIAAETIKTTKNKLKRLKADNGSVDAKEIETAKKTVKEAEKKSERISKELEKLERAITSYKSAKYKAERFRETKDYALGTSLKNYIDPRAYSEWDRKWKKVGFDWRTLYTGSLRKKFTWAMQDKDAETQRDQEEV